MVLRRRLTDQLQPIPVASEKQIEFILQYAQQIIVSGESTQEVLRAFQEMPLIICNDW